GWRGLRVRWTLVGRFRDETGHAVAPGDLLRHAPRAFAEAVARVTVGWAPAAPLIGYSARRVIEREVLTAGCRIVEFGSGRSTPWFRRSGPGERSTLITATRRLRPPGCKPPRRGCAGLPTSHRHISSWSRGCSRGSRGRGRPGARSRVSVWNA